MIISNLNLTWPQVRRFRMARSGLITPFAGAEDAAAALVGVQAQILPAAGLALWNRTRGLTNAGFERALFGERTLVKLWGQRGTLHLYASRDWPLIQAARTINRTWWERQAEDANSSLQDYRHQVEVVSEILRQRETMGRRDLRALDMNLPEELYSPWGGIFADLVRLGYACHAGRDGEGRFAHRERWLPGLEWNPPDAHSANTEIVRRYFAAFGPSTMADLSYWRAALMTTLRACVASLDAEMAEVRVEGTPMLALAADLEELAALRDESDGLPVRLLYRFEPLLLGTRDRSWIVPSEFNNRVSRPAGHIEGILLFRGMAVATWRYDRKGKGIAISVSPFKALPRAVSNKLPKLAQGVADFFAAPLTDLTVTTV